MKNLLIEQNLKEINRKMLQEQKSGLVYRFFVDSEENIYLHLWQEIKLEGEPSHNFGIKKIQLSNENWAFEWEDNSTLKFARISEDNIPSKPKASPLMIMETEKDAEAYDYFRDYLRRISAESFPELNFINELFNRV